MGPKWSMGQEYLPTFTINLSEILGTYTSPMEQQLGQFPCVQSHEAVLMIKTSHLGHQAQLNRMNSIGGWPKLWFGGIVDGSEIR